MSKSGDQLYSRGGWDYSALLNPEKVGAQSPILTWKSKQVHEKEI